MPRLVTWNARGNTVLTAAQRAAVEQVANSARRDQTISVADPNPAVAVRLQGTNVVSSEGEVLGTMAGNPPGPLGAS